MDQRTACWRFSQGCVWLVDQSHFAILTRPPDPLRPGNSEGSHSLVMSCFEIYGLVCQWPGWSATAPHSGRISLCFSPKYSQFRDHSSLPQIRKTEKSEITTKHASPIARASFVYRTFSIFCDLTLDFMIKPVPGGLGTCVCPHARHTDYPWHCVCLWENCFCSEQANGTISPTGCVITPPPRSSTLMI